MVRDVADSSIVPAGWRTRVPGNVAWGVLCVLHIFLRMVWVILAYASAQRRPDPHWTYGQAVRTTFIRMATIVMSQLGAMDTVDMRCRGRYADQWQIIEPAEQDAYIHVAALRSATVRPQSIGATWYPRRPTEAELHDPSTKVVLWFHAGSFIYLSGRPGDCGTAAGSLYQSFNDASPDSATFSLWPQYRLAGCENEPTTFPGPMQDALTAYLFLIRQLGVMPSQIVIGGDSSGGTMALGLLRYLTEWHDKEASLSAYLPPSACILLSPSVDYGIEGDVAELQSNRNAATDCVDLPMLAWATAVFAPPPIVLTSPYLSPARHPFCARVPMFVQAGADEVLCDSIRAFVAAYEGENQVEYFELPYAPHDVFALGHMLGWRKEAQQVCQLAVRFVTDVRNAVTPMTSRPSLPTPTID